MVVMNVLMDRAARAMDATEVLFLILRKTELRLQCELGMLTIDRPKKCMILETYHHRIR